MSFAHAIREVSWEGGDGGPELVIRGEHPGEHVADAGDAAVFAAHQGEPFQREGRPGTVSQQVLKALKIARHVAVDECNPDAGVHRKPTVLSSEHVGGRIGVDEPLHAEPTHDTPAQLLGECGQIGLGDRPGRQERRRPVNGWHEDAVGRARMQVHVVIDRRSEAVQKGDGAESRASRARPVTVTGQARRGTEQPLDLFDEDPREGCDRVWAVSEEAAQSLRHGDHPLPHGHRGNDAVHEMRSCLCQARAVPEEFPQSRYERDVTAGSIRTQNPLPARACGFKSHLRHS
jgi:hypothetical protein